MSTERPSFEVKPRIPHAVEHTVATPLNRPSENQTSSMNPAIAEALQKETGLELDTVRGVLQKLTDEQKNPPTERQLWFRKMYQTGELSPYWKDRGPVRFDACKKAVHEAFTKPIDYIRHIPQHIRAIDIDFRGGKDIGDAKERLQRVAGLLGTVALFTLFDRYSSKPIKKRFPYNKDAENLSQEENSINARNGAINRLFEVMNDKYATALGNLMVEKLTGTRGRYIHEPADKGADTITVGFSFLDDWVNGATLESSMRILSQFPIGGALVEQAVTRLANLQEKSPMHTATGKMMYMALGIFILESRKKTRTEDIIGATARAAF